MPSPLINGQPVTLVRRAVSGQDARHNDVFTETSVSIPYCIIAPGASSEVTTGTEVVGSDVTVYFPDGTNVDANDAMILPDGGKYEIQGNPNQWHSPFTGMTSFVEVRGRLVTGGSV